MTDAGISVEELHRLSGLARGTITKARHGAALLRSTQVSLFDALVGHKRCHFLGRFRNRLLVDFVVGSPSAVADDELKAAVMAGFVGGYGESPGDESPGDESPDDGGKRSVQRRMM
jgi:hypothetical protein